MAPTRINFGTRPWLYCCHAIAIVAALQMIVSVAFATNRNIDLLYDNGWGIASGRAHTMEVQDDKAVILGSVKSDGIAALVSVDAPAEITSC